MVIDSFALELKAIFIPNSGNVLPDNGVAERERGSIYISVKELDIVIYVAVACLKLGRRSVVQMLATRVGAAVVRDFPDLMTGKVV